jgi:outer membrane protein
LTGVLTCGTAAHSNDLRHLYELALTRDPTLQAASSQRDAAVEVKPQALSQLLPQVAATASGMRERADYAALNVGGTQAVDCTLSPDNSTEHCHASAHSLGLQLSQTVWSYEAFSQVKEASFQAAAAESGWRGEQQNLLLRVSRAYFTILSATDQLAANRGERDAFGTLLTQARTREQTGVGPRSDVEQAQSFFDATEENVIDAQNALDDADLAMTQIVGSFDERIAPLREEIPLTTPDPASADEWVAAALRDNFDVRVAQLSAQAAEREVSVQRGKGLPTLTLTGSTSRLWQDAVLGGNQAFDAVALSFQWPLFQGGAVASAVRQAGAQYRQAQSQYEVSQRLCERNVRAAYRGIVTGLARIAAARRAVASGQKAVEASRRNVEFGTGNEFDLLNAQNNYYSSVRAYDQARYDYLTSVLTLKQQAGRLTEHDLAAIDDLLVER